MSIQNTISLITRNLISGFAELDTWLDKTDQLPESNGTWTRLQMIEHVMLTNHFLLILIEKGTEKAIERSRQLDKEFISASYDFDIAAILDIARPGAFRWKNPQHMEPTGSKTAEEIRAELRDQLYRCLVVLDKLSHGEGVAYKLTMSVNNLGKLDMYQYIFFLSLHVQRHLHQLRSEAFLTSARLEIGE